MKKAVVVGAGHNGLTTAVFLQQAGYAVTVVERMDRPGGLCAPVSVHPGYTLPGLLHETGHVRRHVTDALGLEKHGLCFTDAPTPFLAAHREHQGVMLHADAAKSRDELTRLEGRDAEAYAQLRAFIGRVRGFVNGVLSQPPPPLSPERLPDFLAYGKQGLALRRLGQKDMIELLRVGPMCAADWLQEQFTSPLLSAALSASAILGTFFGPWSAGTAALLLLHECTRGPSVEGGPAALTLALVKALGAAGGSVKTSAEVKRIVVEQGRAKGVVLADGTTLSADIVACACDPKTALLGLVEPLHLPLEVEEQLRVVRMRGTSAKVHLALDGEVAFRGREGQRVERALVGEHVDDLERAFDAVKYQGFAARPHLDVWVPSATTRGAAPDGKDVVSLLVHFAAYDLEGGWTDAQREKLGDAALDVLEEVAPGTKGKVLAREVLAPVDLEERYGLTGGQLTHGEHALDQLWFMRPTPALARYKTPIDGLFLCGSGSHPGGGVTCQPGALAAQAIIKDR